MDMLDIYTDYLICQNKYATATGLSDMVGDEFSHDKVTRFLRQGDFDSKMLWNYVNPAVRACENRNGVLLLDDSIKDKPYTDENEVNCWHYSHAKGDVVYKVWLKGLTFPVQVLKKVFKNQNGTTGTLYLVSNDMLCSAERLYEVYQKRWTIEEFHKSIKQNASLEKSPTKKVKTQCNHVYAAMIAYCKLETLKFKTGLNHFAIKYKLIIRANQIAMQELRSMAC
ncbi:MAG: transposase [Legionella sp.]